MRLTSVEVANHSRIEDLALEVRGHVAIVGANDVGKSSLLRLLHLTLGASTAQLYGALTPDDLRDKATTMHVSARFDQFTTLERGHFHREITIDPADKSESLEVRLEVLLDPHDDQAVTISRWCPGRGDVRSLTRDQLTAIGWRFLSAARGSSPSMLDGPNGVETVVGVDPEVLAASFTAVR